MIIGISGYARSGKDSVANILVQDFGFERRAFADKLREALYALNPIIAYDWDLARPIYLGEVISMYGWDGIKSSRYADEVRRLLQRMGTEVGRETLGQNIWVNATFDSLEPGKNYVFTDCRFINEATAVRNDYEGGQVWRVSRPNVGPANDHISEVGLDNWIFDAKIHNNGTLTDLRESVRMLMNR